MTFKNVSIHMNYEENIVQFIILQLEDTNFNPTNIFERLNAYNDKITVSIHLYNHFEIDCSYHELSN